MRHVVIFAGTTEGRTLAGILDRAGVPLDICVATEYGEMILPGFQKAKIHRGRMDEKEMETFLTKEPRTIVVDATHPFAQEVSSNIHEAAAKLKLDYLRLLRDEQACLNQDHVKIFSKIEEGADFLDQQEGNILLTTGSKDLDKIAGRFRDLSRVYVRVLPSEESIRLCHEAGFFGRQIIAMQGPVSEKMHQATLEDLRIQWQMTKASGRVGGVEEKLAAAALVGVNTVMISRPPEQGYSFSQVLRMMANRLGLGMELEHYREEEKRIRRAGRPAQGRLTEDGKKILHLIAIGPGGQRYLTDEAKEALADCQIIFGAGSLLDRLQLPEDLDTEREYRQDYVREYLLRHPEISSAGVVFSGDLGFFSGAAAYPGPYDLFKNPSERSEWADWEILRHCGLSSPQYLASKAGIVWQDAFFISLHGREDDALGQIRSHEKCFIIFSRGEQIAALARTLLAQRQRMDLILGYQLGCKGEKVIFCDLKEAADISYAEGLWSAFFIGKRVVRPLTPVLEDRQFLRDKVPMTKEEIRHLSVLALGLKPGDILYDIGAGSGSVAMEAANISPDLTVYAIEQKTEAVDLIRRNMAALDLNNIKLIHGRAPAALEDLPDPNAVFIGGSSGALRAIFEELWRCGKPVRFVLNAITLETLAEYQRLAVSLPIRREKISLVQVSRARNIASYHMMMAENGIYIISGVLGEE